MPSLKSPSLHEMAFIVLLSPWTRHDFHLWDRKEIKDIFPEFLKKRQAGDSIPIGGILDYKKAARSVRFVTNKVNTRRHSFCDIQLQF